jgi:hypothetical protein
MRLFFDQRESVRSAQQDFVVGKVVMFQGT